MIELKNHTKRYGKQNFYNQNASHKFDLFRVSGGVKKVGVVVY